jgi:non-specific serine/threonine protein kinase
LAWVRASVFAGRFDLDAAEAVCAGEGLPSDELLDALAGLIDKSVLASVEQDGVRRFWMLDTMRAYGLERLRGLHVGDRNVIGEPALRRRHRDYYHGVAERFNADWFGPRQLAWSRRMRAELPELRAGLSFCLATPGEAAAAVRVAGTLNFFWWGCSAAREGSLWLERALTADASPTTERAHALAVYGRTLTARSLHAEAAEPTRECLELARQFDDPALLAEALSGRGLHLLHTGDPPAALPLLDEALERAAAIPDIPIALALATLCRGAAALADGDPILADAMAARSRDVARAHGDRWWLNYALGLSIPPALMLGDVARATAYGRESLSGCTALGDTNGITLILEFLAWAVAADGDHTRAARLLGAADQQAWVNGGNPTAAGLYAATHDQCRATARAALGNARFDAEFRTGAELTLDEIVAYAQGDGPTSDPPHARISAPPRSEPPHLTKREFEIAELLAEGLTNKQIAHQLVIAQRTAESHVENILNKLGFTTRTQVATWMVARETTDRAPNGQGSARRLR